MSSWTSLFRRFRRDKKPRTEGEKAHDREWDARSDMVDGKALSPTGAVMDFERDSAPPR
jgi:hypothetical protein